jgi:hypothetical protein
MRAFSDAPYNCCPETLVVSTQKVRLLVAVMGFTVIFFFVTVFVTEKDRASLAGLLCYILSNAHKSSAQFAGLSGTGVWEDGLSPVGYVVLLDPTG